MMLVLILCVMGMLGQALSFSVCNEQTMVRHKSRLEREKEAAADKKKASPKEAGSHERQLKAPAQSSLPGEVSKQAIAVNMAGMHCP